LRSAVIMSPPDTREGHEAIDEDSLPEVQEWWQNNVGNRREEDYTREMIEAFATDEGPDLLIVVWKLLTGFDEPRNAVLYIDKPLEKHNLIQAIARVNRLHEQKQFGLLIDYRGILKELDTAMQEYQDLAEHTQGGFDIDDLDGLYRQVDTEYKRLPNLHERLWAIFDSVQDRTDFEQFRHVLIPKIEEDSEGGSHDTRLKVRDDFYQALTEFGLCLKVALSSVGFFEDGSITEDRIREYKNDLKFFSDLRVQARRDAAETVDYSAYESQIRRLVDQQVIGEDIREPEGVYLVNELGREDPTTWSEEKTRNETDIIKTRIRRSIEQDLADDPYAQRVFSELLKEAIAEARAQFEHPFKQYALYKDLEERLQNRELDAEADAFGDNRHARAYYGLFRLVLGEDAFGGLSGEEIDAFTAQALDIDAAVETAVAEHSLNPQNIEAEIRKRLLPALYKSLGMDRARELIERVIQMTRIGLARSEET